MLQVLTKVKHVDVSRIHGEAELYNTTFTVPPPHEPTAQKEGSSQSSQPMTDNKKEEENILPYKPHVGVHLLFTLMVNPEIIRQNLHISAAEKLIGKEMHIVHFPTPNLLEHPRQR